MEYYAGIDEAGRGPVLGPLVYCLYLIPVQSVSLLSEFGAADSKALTSSNRNAFFKKSVADNQPAWLTRIISPEDISDAMLRSNKYNLNDLSHDTVYELLEEALSIGVCINHLFVDTLGPAQKYQDKLERRFPGKFKVTVSAKADSLYPVVSAASIIAKVIRDYCLEHWTFLPGFEPKSREFGCGYPSDPITVKWLHNNVDKVFGFSDIVRFSWSSCQRILDAHAFPVQFAFESTPNQQKGKEKRKTNNDLVVPIKKGFTSLSGLNPIHKFELFDGNKS